MCQILCNALRIYWWVKAEDFLALRVLYSCHVRRGGDRRDNGMADNFEGQENWPHCLQSAPSGPDQRCIWRYWSLSKEDSTETACVLHPHVQVWGFFILGPPMTLALGQYSNEVSPSKPLPLIAFPDLLCHRHFSTFLVFQGTVLSLHSPRTWP